MSKKLNKPLIRKWVKALESGEYNQCKGTLIKHDPKKDTDSFCCLGVLCMVEGFEIIDTRIQSMYETDEEFATDERDLEFIDPRLKTEKATIANPNCREESMVPQWSKSGLQNSEHADKLVNMNDVRSANFKTIAKYIRKDILGE